MDVEKQKNDDTSNVESLKRNNRLFLVGLIIVFCLMASGLVYQQREIISLKDDLKEVADSVKYDLNRHSSIDSDEELELKVDALMSTDWFKKRTIENSLDKKSIFAADNSDYYVYMYKDDCGFCKETEAHMFEKLEAIKKKNIYFADITEAKEESDKWVSKKEDILWTEESDEREVYTTTKNDLAISGTPTMIKVSKGKKDIMVYVGLDAIEGELGID